ncbi:iron transport multicopper oxidase fet3 [Gigaspora margarita]|uniref:Iron transport multicopper oxidase fet3 n=1 Tax=Gigaspora margarita TaxID=4874 RepID=A0A8H3XIP3_GIGMA|nr:iron transport multicopper oxidase fet3 [Gigaspora margarita]
MISKKTLFLVIILIFLLLPNVSLSFPKKFSSHINSLNKRNDRKVYNLTITNKKMAPDGFTRKMFVINDKFPGPLIEVNKGDTLVLDVKNDCDDVTTMHAHGFFQRGTPWYDGVPGQTQCDIQSKKSFTYEFQVNQSGTFWYHSHSKAQYIEGIVGALIVHDPDDPYLKNKDYDEEIVVLLQDWYHTDSKTLLATFLSPESAGNEPTPDNGLINGMNSYNCSGAPNGSDCVSDAPLANFKFVQGKKYRIRIINTSAFAAFIFSIDNHPMDVIEVEGMITQRRTIHRLPINIAQRYSVIVTADKPIGKYWMRSEMETACFAIQSDTLNPLVKAIVEYEGSDANSNASSTAWTDSQETCVDLDTSTLKPYEAQTIPDADYKLTLNVSFQPDDKNVTRGFINNSSYVDPNSPTLLKVYENKTTFDSNRNAYIIDKDKVVDIILYNTDTGDHPFHLHGHVFWVLGIGINGTSPDYNSVNTKDPIQRDTVTAPAGGWFIIRFVSNNPGVWGFHCHIEWHVQSGLVAQFVTQPDKIKELKSPDDWSNLCKN